MKYLTILTVLMLTALTSIYAQTPTYSCDIRNEQYVSASIFEFDIYLTRTGTAPLELAGFQTGLKINSGFVNGGSITPSIVSGSSGLNSSQIPTAIAWDASSYCIKLAPRRPPRNLVTGLTSGTVIDNADGTKVCRIRLTNSVSFGADPIAYTWNYTVSPYNTIVSAFIPGTPPLNLAITDQNAQSRSHIVKCFVQGLYNGSGNSKAQDASGNHFTGPVADLVTVKLAQSSSPYTIVKTVSGANLSTNGNCTVNLPGSYNGSYYIVLNHRNGIETWSAAPVSFAGNVNYDFSNAASKAFGNNLRNMGGGVYALYTGDLNGSGILYPNAPAQDGVIDLDDLYYMYDSYLHGDTGYLVSDANGDGVVDLDDIYLSYDNFLLGIYRINP